MHVTYLFIYCMHITCMLHIYHIPHIYYIHTTYILHIYYIYVAHFCKKMYDSTPEQHFLLV